MNFEHGQAEIQGLASRVAAAGEYLAGLISEALDVNAKGEWLACVRARLREVQAAGMGTA